MTHNVGIGAYKDVDAVKLDLQEMMSRIQADAQCSEGIRELFGITADGEDEVLSESDDEDGEWLDEDDVTVPFPAEKTSSMPSQSRPSKRKLSDASLEKKDDSPVAEEGSEERPPLKKKRIRSRKSMKTKTEGQKLNSTLRNWKRINRNAWKEAARNIHVVKGFDLMAHLSKDQTRTVKPLPDFDSMPRTVWNDDVPRMAVDEKGVPLVVAFPKWIRRKALDILNKVLMDFGREVEVNIKTAADKNARDVVASYERRRKKKEIHGVFQLVTLWRGIGHCSGPAGPSRDVLKKMKNLNASIGLLKELRMMSKRIDHLFKLIDPSQHTIFSEAKKRLGEMHESYGALNGIDPTFFHGRSLIYNRATPCHTDDKDLKAAWTPVVSVGDYTSGTMRVLDLDVAYGPGTAVFVRGGSLPHGVTYEGGQRIAVAHFMHRDVLKDVGVGPLPITPIASWPRRRASPK